ncbi:hypothetical protein WR164_13270 [Philodulcilactobacillus myokoensis]|uniref:DUF1541 domain-containing protein n=1 Tax=Philodulcilactobacillus myokoensis TaxID=2929573 RepID=A0A9W6ETM0_9LACO|nr:YdhK family protein [Philodulcilactobacillus myokoensis]GLB47348.1 hypothetical protein WR164_13270 [Philodulcilactobacillus myokoensis]
MKMSRSLVKVSTAAGLLLLFSTPAFASSKKASHMSMHHEKTMRMSHKKSSKKSMSSMGNMNMNMGSKSSLKSSLKGLKVAKHPKFKKGERVISLANHMMGMKGAKATIVNAYNTKLYEVDYKPTTGGKVVKNHKWLVKSELKSNHNALKVGTKVTLNTDHMKGMKGAKAKIVAIHKGPAYMINYKPTTGGKVVKNHMWLVQSEIKK